MSKTNFKKSSQCLFRVTTTKFKYSMFLMNSTSLTLQCKRNIFWHKHKVYKFKSYNTPKILIKIFAESTAVDSIKKNKLFLNIFKNFFHKFVDVIKHIALSRFNKYVSFKFTSYIKCLHLNLFVCTTVLIMTQKQTVTVFIN